MCIGDDIGDKLRSGVNAGNQHTQESALQLANKHMDEMDDDDNGFITRGEVDDQYKNFFDAINYHTNKDDQLTVDELATAYKHSNIHERGAAPDCFTGTNG